MRKIFFVIPYPLKRAPSQRFRFEQYLPLLEQKGYQFRIANFLTEASWSDFHQDGKILNKTFALIRGAIQRIRLLAIINEYDFIFVHREATPVGPPIIEWVITKLYRKKMIYDFDDAIWLADGENETFIRRKAKWRSKVEQICKLAYKVSCGNEYLCDYARRFNASVVYNPTIVDTNYYHNPRLFSRREDSAIVTIGWTGSHSTIKYLINIAETLNEIQCSHPNVRILIIADRQPETPPLSNFDFIYWNADSEIDDLMKIDIGIMPLPDDPWSKGKCGFKLIQYMALGIPAVASPVGVNVNLINHGEEGFLAESPREWHEHLTALVVNESLRKTMGEKGRRKVVDQYSLTSNAPAFLALFE